MQAHFKEVSLAKIVFITLLIKSFPLLLPSHNCINNVSMFSFQGASLNLFFKKLNEASNFLATSVNSL